MRKARAGTAVQRGQDRWATSMIGFIALAGIIVHNSTLMADRIHLADPEGRTTLDILIEAGATGFEQILMTALIGAQA